MTDSVKVLLAVLATHAQTALSLVSGVLVPTLLLATLGKSSYGTLLLVTSAVAYASLADLGFAYTVQRALATHYVRGEWAEINRRVSDALLFYTLVALFLGVIGGLVAPHAATLLRLTGAAETALVRNLFLVCLAGVIVRLFSNLVEGAFVAFHAQHVASVLTLTGSLLGLAGAILSLYLGRGIVTYAAFMSLLPPATVLVGAFFLGALVPQLRFALPQARGAGSLLSSMMPAAFVFLLQINALVAFNGDNLIIGLLLGPAAVVPYSLIYRVIFMSMQLTNSVATNLFPIAARLNAEGQVEVLSALHWLNVKLAVGAGCFLGIFTVTFADRIIAAWTGPGNFAGNSVSLVLALWLVVLCAVHPTVSILMLRHRERALGILGLITSFANVFLSFLLVSRIGVVGTALATLAMTAINALFVLRWAKHEFMRTSPARHALGVMRAVFPTALLVTVVAILARGMIAGRLETASRATTLLQLTLVFVMLGLLHALVAWRLSLSASERRIVTKRLGPQFLIEAGGIGKLK